MKTLFNTLTKQAGQFRSTPYTVNGKPGQLPDNVVELDVVFMDRPTGDIVITETGYKADLKQGKYRQFYEHRDMTDQEKLERQISEAEAKDQEIDPVEIKRIARKVLSTETEEVQALHPSMYPAFKGGEAVDIGDLRTFESVVYRVIQAHTTEYWHKPPEIPALWERHFADTGTDPENPCEGVKTWDANDHWTSYVVGDRRVDESKLYECHNTAYSYHKPSGEHGHHGWTYIQDCL